MLYTIHVSCQYVGQWLNGQKHGPGTFTATAEKGEKGPTYTGDWMQGHRHGRGVLKDPLVGTHEGHYQGGEFHGKGKMAYTNGDVFEGVWLHNQKQGKGSLVGGDKQKWVVLYRDDELIEKVAVD